MASDAPIGPAEHLLRTRKAYDRLAAVWSETTDDGPWNCHLERPAFRSLVPPDLTGMTVLDPGCGSGAQAEWLLDQGADVIGVDLSAAMIQQTELRCAGRGKFFVADLSVPLPLEPRSVDGVTCSLALHYLQDWSSALESFSRALRPGGWAVLSLDHPFARPLATRQGGYFDTELVSDTWQKRHVQVTQHFWRRPLPRRSTPLPMPGSWLNGSPSRSHHPKPLRAFLKNWARSWAYRTSPCTGSASPPASNDNAESSVTTNAATRPSRMRRSGERCASSWVLGALQGAA